MKSAWVSLDLRQHLAQLPPKPWPRPCWRNNLYAFDLGQQSDFSAEGGAAINATATFVPGLGYVRNGGVFNTVPPFDPPYIIAAQVLRIKCTTGPIRAGWGAVGSLLLNNYPLLEIFDGGFADFLNGGTNTAEQSYSQVYPPGTILRIKVEAVGTKTRATLLNDGTVFTSTNNLNGRRPSLRGNDPVTSLIIQRL